MERYILHCDFSVASDDTVKKFREEMSKFKEELPSLGRDGILGIITAFQQRVCVVGFPGVSSAGFDLTKLILNMLLDTVSEKVEENVLSSQEMEDRLLDLYVGLLKSGPGSSHCEILKTITKHMKFQDLYGDRLQKVVEGFKAITYVEESDVSSYIDTVKRDYPDLLEETVLRRNSDYLMMPEVHKACTELFVFYLVLLPQTSVSLRETLERAQDKIYKAYDGEPFHGLSDADFYKSQLIKLQDFIKDPEFPQSKEVCEITQCRLGVIFELKDSAMIVKVYADIVQLLKILSMKNLTPDNKSLLESLKGFHKNIPDDCFMNTEMFKAWAVAAAEILEKSPRETMTGESLARTADKFIEFIKPKAELAKLWLSIVVGFCQWAQTKTIRVAGYVISEDKWKSYWKWKENVSVAKDMIVALTTTDYSYCDNVEEYSSRAESFIERLMKQLKLLKVDKHVECELSELAMVTMEAVGREIMVDRLCRTASKMMSLQNNKQLIVEYLDRFLRLLKNEDYDWDRGWMTPAGMDFFKNLVKSSSGGEMRDMETDDAFLRVLLFCLSEDREYISLQRQGLNIFGLITVTGLTQFIVVHKGKPTIGRLKPLFPHIQRLMDSEEEMIKTTMRSVMQMFGEDTPKLMDISGMKNLISFYLKEKDLSTLNAISAAYVEASEPLASQFLPLIQAFTQTESDEMPIQLMFLKKVAEIQPELFTRDVFKLLFNHHFIDKQANAQTWLVMEIVSRYHPENLEPFLESHLMRTGLMMEIMAHYQVNILIKVATKYQDKQGPVCSYLMKRIKESNYEQAIISSIQGLRELHSIGGAKIFTPDDRKYIESLKTKGLSQSVRDLAENLIDELEGRSLAKVSQDVEEHSGQIGKLEIGVAGTKVVLKKVQRDVKQQGKEIEGIKEELVEVNTRVDQVEADVEETKEKLEEVDKKTMSNAPIWSRDVTKLMNPESEHDWRLLASRLGYSPDDIRGWATQSDPCMALLSEWYATHKTYEASRGVLNILQEMNRLDAAAIVENAMKAAEGVVADEPVDYPEPPEIFLSYQWGHQNEVKLISRHLEMAGYKCWMDVGQMGGGDKLFEKIDSGIRAAKVIISCVTEKYAKSPNCNREVNLSVNLGKPMIPLLLEKMSWPPPGSMGPIFSEFLFIRFFQRPGEETKDDRIWPAAKFTELLMQLNCLKVMPDEKNISKEYKDWWIPVVEKIVIPKRNEKKVENPQSSTGQKSSSEVVSPDVFISYQWGKQKEIMALYRRLTSLGFTCWMDIHQMGGGDSLYDKIDRGVRGCKVVLSSVTTKYALSANCRREVSLADALKKPIIPMLMEKIDWPPTGPMSMVLTQLLYVNFSKEESIQLSWEGAAFNELLLKVKQHVSILEHDSNQDEKHNKVDTTSNNSQTAIPSTNGDTKKHDIKQTRGNSTEISQTAIPSTNGDTKDYNSEKTRENSTDQRENLASHSVQPQTSAANTEQPNKAQSYPGVQPQTSDANTEQRNIAQSYPGDNKKKSSTCDIL